MPISGAERAAKHYEANKAKILERKRLAYAAKKLLKNPQPIIENEEPIEIINEKIEPIKIIKSVAERRRSVIKGLAIKQQVQEPEPVKINNKLSEKSSPIMTEISKIINSFDDTTANKNFRILQMKLIIKILNPTSFKILLLMLKLKPNHVVKLLQNY